MKWLIDTNVLSELRRPNPSRAVVDFMSALPPHLLAASVVNLAELRFGIAKMADPVRGTELMLWLDYEIRPMFSDRVLPITEGIMFRWRLMLEEGRKSGRTLPQPDLLIAATALEHNLTLVTRNVKDFAGLGVAILNPWERQP